MSAKLLFFSGGTALRSVAQTLVKEGIESVHLVTTFDSGGSSAQLRKTFGMPAVGDLRNRLLALASPSRFKFRDVCAARISPALSFEEARTELKLLLGPESNLWKIAPQAQLERLQAATSGFLAILPASFDARNASLGNILLSAVYLASGRDIEPALQIMAEALKTRGIVAPICNANLHLGARLANGEIILGQHLFRNIDKPVQKLFLTAHDSLPEDDILTQTCRPVLAARARAYLGSAKIICYPMGSFFTSVLANLLPKGVGQAIARSSALKVFIPNSGHDPELCGLDILAQTEMLLNALREDEPNAAPKDFLDLVLVDASRGQYPGGISGQLQSGLERLGVRLVDCPIVSIGSPGRHDSNALIAALRKLAKSNGADL